MVVRGRVSVFLMALVVCLATWPSRSVPNAAAVAEGGASPEPSLRFAAQLGGAIGDFAFDRDRLYATVGPRLVGFPTSSRPVTDLAPVIVGPAFPGQLELVAALPDGTLVTTAAAPGGSLLAQWRVKGHRLELVDSTLLPGWATYLSVESRAASSEGSPSLSDARVLVANLDEIWTFAYPWTPSLREAEPVTMRADEIAQDLERPGFLGLATSEAGTFALVVDDRDGRAILAAVGADSLDHLVDLPPQDAFLDAVRLSFDGSRLYVTGSDLIVDLEDPMAPTTSVTPRRMPMGTVSGGILYATADGGGVLALDVQAPEMPVRGASTWHGGEDCAQHNLAVSGGFLAVGDAGIVLADISRVAAARDLAPIPSLGGWSTLPAAAGVSTPDRHVFATTGARIWDLGGAHSLLALRPGHSNTYPIQSGVLCASGDFEPVDATRDHVLAFLSAASPAYGTLYGRGPHALTGLGDVGPLPRVQDVTIEGRWAYVTSEKAVHVIDLEALPSEAIVQSISAPDGSYRPRDAAASGGRLAIATSTQLEVWGVSDPVHPIGLATVPGGFDHVAASGSLLAAAGASGLTIFALEAGRPPTLLSHIDRPWVRDLALDGTRLFLLEPNGVSEFDLSNPALPRFTAAVTLYSGADLHVQDGLLTVAAQEAGLWVYDLRPAAAWLPAVSR